MAPNSVEKIADVHKRRETNRPKFDKEKVKVVFALGSPGAVTQCSFLVQKYNFSCLSTSDLLRAEQDRPGSQFGDLIRTRVREGGFIPLEVTVKVLENAMDAVLESKSGEGWGDGKGRFLVDGPRQISQALKFEEEVCPSSLVLFFTTDEETMLRRVLERGKTSGRDNNNIESIKKNFSIYKDATMPVIEYYEKSGKVAQVDSFSGVDEIHTAVVAVVAKVLA